MAPANRLPMSDVRRFSVAGLIVAGVFLVCCGTGMSNVVVGGAGIALAVGGPVFILTSRWRADTKRYVRGTAHVHEISPPPSTGKFGRGEMELVVNARGVDTVPVRHRDGAIPVNRWPDVGATLPVRVVVGNPRHMSVLWNEVRTHREVAFDDDMSPDYNDGVSGDGYPVAGDSKTEHPNGAYARGDRPIDRYPSDEHTPDPRSDQPHSAELPAWTSVGTEGEPLNVVLHPVGVSTGTAGTPDTASTAGTAGTPDTASTAGTPGTPGTAGTPETAGTMHTAGKAGPQRRRPSPHRRRAVAGSTAVAVATVAETVRPSVSPPSAYAVPEAGAGLAEPATPMPLDIATPSDVAADPADELEAEPVAGGGIGRFLPTGTRRPAGVAFDGVSGVSVTLIVSDLQRSRRFYRATLGLAELDSGPSSAVLASGDARVVLRRVADMPPVDRRVVHLNLEVADVYEAYDRLRDGGVEFVHRPRVVPQGEQLDLCSATFRDPDGHAIALTRWELRR